MTVVENVVGAVLYCSGLGRLKIISSFSFELTSWLISAPQHEWIFVFYSLVQVGRQPL